MRFIEENVVRNRLYHTFFEKLSKLSDDFIKTTKHITDRYVKIVNENKSKIESEILVQDKFLEFNNTIDNLFNSVSKKGIYNYVFT